MKKHSFWLLFCIFAATIISCMTAKPVVLDDSVPPEQSASIVLGYYTIKSFNQVEVNREKLKIVTVPAGDVTFTGDIDWVGDATKSGTYIYFGSGVGGPPHRTFVIEAKDIGLSCTLEPGKEYWGLFGPYREEMWVALNIWSEDVWKPEEEMDEPVVWGIYLIERGITKKADVPLKDSPLVGFLQFDPPLVTPPMLEWPYDTRPGLTHRQLWVHQ
jgi:hypothetical protein